MHRTTVAIIGGGCSGTLVALQLLKQSGERPLDIILVERSGSIGTGLAYSAPSDLCKLNVPAKAMGAFPDDPEGFYRWLSRNHPHVMGDEFVSRRLFGEYLQELFTNYSQGAGQTTVTTIADSVTDLAWDESHSQFRLELSKTAPLYADFGVLALGNIPRASLDGVLIREAFSVPYEPHSYQNIEQLNTLLVVGSGLTAIDVILEAEAHGFRGCYTMVSRHGRIPCAHENVERRVSDTLDPRLHSGDSLSTLSLRHLLTLVRSEATRVGSSQPVIAALRPHIQKIWASLSCTDKRRFLRHIRPLWEVHRHRIPKAHWDIIEALRSSNRLRVVSGRIKSTSTSSAQVEVTISSQGGIEREIFDRAFICAGFEEDLTKVEMPLIQNLLASGIIASGELRLGVAPGATSLAENAASRLHIIGSLQREALWEITAVRELRICAEQIVAHIITGANTLPQRTPWGAST